MKEIRMVKRVFLLREDPALVPDRLYGAGFQRLRFAQGYLPNPPDLINSVRRVVSDQDEVSHAFAFGERHGQRAWVGGIPSELFERLWPLTGDRRLRGIRWTKLVSTGESGIEFILDCLLHPSQPPLYLGSVKVIGSMSHSREEQMSLPDTWLSSVEKDVTGNDAYYMRNLAWPACLDKG